LSKPENDGAITITIKGHEAKILRDLMSDEKLKNRKRKDGPKSYSTIVIAALFDRYQGELAERRADKTRILEEAAAKRETSPF
jgi:hypothetical protein